MTEPESIERSVKAEWASVPTLGARPSKRRAAVPAGVLVPGQLVRNAHLPF
jgi:hypothetical protein